MTKHLSHHQVPHGTAKGSVIKQLIDTSSRLEKEAILHQAILDNQVQLFIGLHLCYDPLITFGIKELPERNTENSLGVIGYNFIDFLALCDNLQNRRLTGNALEAAILKFAKGVDEDEWELFYSRVLKKDMQCGIGIKTINKVIEDAGELASQEIQKQIIKVMNCMLAETYEDHKASLRGKYRIEPKLDGIRVLAVLNAPSKEVVLYTRDGKVTTNFPHINEALEHGFKRGLSTSYVLDGELTADGFTSLMSMVNSKASTGVVGEKEKVIYNIFDVVPLREFLEGQSNNPLDARQIQLQSVFNTFCHKREYLKLVPSTRVYINNAEGQQQMADLYKEYIAQGLEGIVLKDVTARYTPGRNKAWLKLKPTLTIDLEIDTIEEGTGRNQGRMGFLTCHTFQGKKLIKTKVGSGFTDEQRQEIWDNKEKYLGSTIEVIADSITTDSKNAHSLRFPRFSRFRTNEVTGEKL